MAQKNTKLVSTDKDFETIYKHIMSLAQGRPQLTDLRGLSSLRENQWRWMIQRIRIYHTRKHIGTLCTFSFILLAVI
ncbi:uncharacterized protein Bfra_006327 [Botrytis fragariae]|uniref:Uncharacterized protein n=1 Tax=Botrytis fragariae TaxID=1964551 RepID=A0A8H6ENW7_9HELO|nr:uncharacterized protein Bfra_006327 [Botrytis fragariae]KAF5879122.1 hypothetical protein Bfra_006327 [Botrytis fragariae]